MGCNDSRLCGLDEGMPSQLTFKPYNPSNIRHTVRHIPPTEFYHDNKGAFSISHKRDSRGNLRRNVEYFSSRRAMRQSTTFRRSNDQFIR
jgi:hypothetical protein